MPLIDWSQKIVRFLFEIVIFSTKIIQDILRSQQMCTILKLRVMLDYYFTDLQKDISYVISNQKFCRLIFIDTIWWNDHSHDLL